MRPLVGHVRRQHGLRLMPGLGLSVEVEDADEVESPDTADYHTPIDGDVTADSLPDLAKLHLTAGELSSSKRKLDELFFHWLGLEETGVLVAGLVSDIKVSPSELNGAVLLSRPPRLLRQAV